MTTATIRAVSPARIGIPGNGDAAPAFVGALIKGHLTVSGKTALLTRTVLPILHGHLTVTGKSSRVNSTAWQYVTISSLTSIHVVATLYDALDPLAGLTPAVGDIWRVPLFSQDGGSIIVSVDGRFQIGAPTQGYDVMQNVLYYSILTGLWYGPADFTILNPLLTLSIQRGHVLLQGKIITPTKQRILTSGRIVLFGHQTNVRRALTIQLAHLTMSGKPTGIQRAYSYTPGHLTLHGKTISKTSTLTLQFTSGHLTIAGKILLKTKSIQIITKGHLTVDGKDLGIALGQPLPISGIGHLTATGRLMRLLKGGLIQTSHITLHGKAIRMKTTGAINEIDKPDIVPRRKRRNIVSSQA